MPTQTVRAFVAAVNAHDLEKMTALITDNHNFTDAHANTVAGHDKVKSGWTDYFEWFPDYAIELSSLTADGDTVAAFGFASGTFCGAKTDDGTASWRLPAAWRAVVESGKIKTWQVYADTKIPFDIIAAHAPRSEQTGRAAVTGIGGIFFKSKDPEKLREWYHRHLGLNTDKYGTSFEWRLGTDSTKKGYTQWSPFAETTKYFEPSTKEFMINYRVENLEILVAQLVRDGVTVVDKIEVVEYGKFVHIMDAEGTKIELWEPVDEEYDKIAEGRTK